MLAAVQHIRLNPRFTLIERTARMLAKGFPFLQLHTILTAMSTQQPPQDRTSFADRWNAFLDGYFRSIEFQPMARQNLFIRKDSDALMADFIRTQMDFALTRDLIVADVRFNPDTASTK